MMSGSEYVFEGNHRLTSTPRDVMASVAGSKALVWKSPGASPASVIRVNTRDVVRLMSAIALKCSCESERSSCCTTLASAWLSACHFTYAVTVGPALRAGGAAGAG